MTTVIADRAERHDQAVDEVPAEAVLGPGLHVVLDRRMGGDEDRGAEEPAVGLERQGHHVEQRAERHEGEQDRDDQPRAIPLADAEQAGARARQRRSSAWSLGHLGSQCHRSPTSLVAAGCVISAALNPKSTTASSDASAAA